MSRFLMVLLLAACGGEVASDAPPVARPPVVVAPPPAAPAPLPAYDESLDSPEEVEAWRKATIAAIDEYAALPDPDKVEAKYAASFKVTADSLALTVGDPKAWDVGYDPYPDAPATPAKKRTAAEVAALEAGDEEFEAGLAYAALGDKDSARRCLAALKEEFEWNAVAVLAVALDDEKELHAALDVIASEGRHDLLVGVVGDAIAAGKHDRAVALAKKYEVDLASEDLYEVIRARALAGDSRLLVPFAGAEWERWSARMGDEPGGTITDYDALGHWMPSLEVVVLIGKSDKKKALELARAYLTDPRANVVAWLHCGEGCGTNQVVGTLELYQLVKADPELKAAYLARVRAWGAAAFGDYPEWDEPLIGALMAKVRKAKDADLIKAWDDALGSASDDSVGTVGFLRAVLGLPGATDDLAPFQYGTISPAELKKLWIAFEFPVAPATPRYATAQFAEAIATADALYDSGKHAEADRVYVGLLRSGWKPSPNDMAPDPERPTEFSLALAEAGYPEDAREHVVAHIESVVREASDIRWLAGEAVMRFLAEPEAVRRASEAVDVAREGNEGADKPRGISPHTFEQTNDIVLPVVAALKAKAPELYERFIIDLDAAGNSALYDAELAERNAAGDLTGVQRLAGTAAATE